MKILKLTNQLLIFKLGGGAGGFFTTFFIGIFCALFAGMGVVMIFSAAKTNINCTKGTTVKGECKIEQVGYFSSTFDVIPLEDIDEADVVEYTDSEDDDSYTVYIITDDERITVPGAGGSIESDAEAQAARFNQFLTDPKQAKYVYDYDDRTWMLILGLVLMGIGSIIFLVATPRSKVFVFDKNKNAFLIAKRGIMGSKIFGSVEHYELSKVTGAWTESYTDEGTVYYEALLGVNQGSKEKELTLIDDATKFIAEKYSDTVNKFLEMKSS